MMRILHDENTHELERKGIVQSLGYLLKPTDVSGVRALVMTLQDTVAGIRKEAAISIGKIKPKSDRYIVQALIRVATQPSERDSVKMEALKALKEIKPKWDGEVQRKLLFIAKDRYVKSSVRAAALKVLEDFLRPVDHAAIWDMYELITDVNHEVRMGAITVLETIKPGIYAIDQLLNIQELYQKTMSPKDKRFNPAPKPFGSWFEVRVFLAIHRQGYFVVPSLEFMGHKAVSYQSGQSPYHIDMVIFGDNGKKLAIECDGHQHRRADIRQNDIRRQKELEGFGWKFWRIPVDEFHSQPEYVLEKLWQELAKTGIYPLKPERSQIKTWSLRGKFVEIIKLFRLSHVRAFD